MSTGENFVPWFTRSHRRVGRLEGLLCVKESENSPSAVFGGKRKAVSISGSNVGSLHFAGSRLVQLTCFLVLQFWHLNKRAGRLQISKECAFVNNLFYINL